MPRMIRTYGGITSSDAAIVPDNAVIVWTNAVITSGVGLFFPSEIACIPPVKSPL